MLYLLMPSLETRTQLPSRLKSLGFSGVFHCLPLHLSEMGRRFGSLPGDGPVTQDVSDRLLRPPFCYDLTDEDQVRVMRAIMKWDDRQETSAS